MATQYKVSHVQLRKFTAGVFQAFGLRDAEAKIAAETMVEADLRGIATHGVLRLGLYLERLRRGGTAYNTSGRIISETATTALIDGENGIGAVIAQRAAALARKKALESNVSFVSVRGSNHFGIAAYWAQIIAGQELIGFAGSNVEPLMPAAGSRAPTIGNNPFSLAVPGGKYPPICLDMACSVVAAAKKFEYELKNQTMPLGWFLDKDGKPTGDPGAAEMVLPFGGYKGYGIAVMVEVLTSLLSGGNFGADFGSQYGDLENPNHTSHYFAAVNIAALRPLGEFKTSVDAYVEYLRSMPTQDGVSRVLYPGEIEEMTREQSLREGILLPMKLTAELCAIAEEVGLPSDTSEFLHREPVG